MEDITETCVSAFFESNTELFEICEDLEIYELCREMEERELTDSTYDKELYDLCAAIEENMKYPYDITKSPAYELTYVHQVVALLIAAYLNVAKDTLVAALIAQCRCRFRLLGNALRNLGKGLDTADKHVLTSEQETLLSRRLRWCVVQHQKTLEAAGELQACFSEPTFAQLTVSLIIICVTAFQLSMLATGNMVRLLSMGTYLMNMAFQVFIYCYQGNQLSEESSQIAGAAYSCPWYMCSVRLRRALLIVMTRTRRITKLTAGGFTTLSLASFMAIIKASYSLFTLLQQVSEK